MDFFPKPEITHLHGPEIFFQRHGMPFTIGAAATFLFVNLGGAIYMLHMYITCTVGWFVGPPQKCITKKVLVSLN